MSNSKLDHEFHQEAFVDYCKGMKQPEIAAKYNVSLSSVQRWSYKEKWKELKKTEAQLREQHRVQLEKQHEEHKHEVEVKQKKFAKKLAKFEQDIEDTIFEKICRYIQETTENLLEGSLISSRIALDKLKKAEEKFGSPENRNWLSIKEGEEVKLWTLILKEASHIRKGALPDLPKDLADTILENMEQIKKMVRDSLYYEETNGNGNGNNASETQERPSIEAIEITQTDEQSHE